MDPGTVGHFILQMASFWGAAVGHDEDAPCLGTNSLSVCSSPRSVLGFSRSSAASRSGSVSPRGLCLLARRNLLDVRNGCSVDADSMAEHGIRAEREQVGLVLESLLHLIKVLVDGDRSPSGEVNPRRHREPPTSIPRSRPRPRAASRRRSRCCLRAPKPAPGAARTIRQTQPPPSRRRASRDS